MRLFIKLTLLRIAAMLAVAIWLLAVLWILGNLFSFELPGAIYGISLICMFIVCVFGAASSIYSFVKSTTSSDPVDQRFSVVDPRFKSK